MTTWNPFSKGFAAALADPGNEQLNEWDANAIKGAHPCECSETAGCCIVSSQAQRVILPAKQAAKRKRPYYNPCVILMMNISNRDKCCCLVASVCDSRAVVRCGAPAQPCQAAVASDKCCGVCGKAVIGVVKMQV